MSLTRQLLTFFAIAFGYTWTWAACMIHWHLPIQFSILACAGPLFGALITNRLAYGNYRAFRFTAGWPRTLGAGVLGIALVLGFEIILPATAVADAGKLGWGIFISSSAYNYSTLLGGPLFEEPGWRGFALSRLESRFGPARAGLMLGVIWAAWHLPFFWYPGWNSIRIWIYFLIVSAFSILLTWATNLARFAVIVPILMHAVHNTAGKYFQGLFAAADPGSGGFLPVLARRLSELTGGSVNITMSFELLIALTAWTGAMVALVLTKGRLGYAAGAGYGFPTTPRRT
jgi:CAAX protease family protein